MLSLLKDLDEAVQECSEPQEPFQEGCQHDRPDDRRVYNLSTSQYNIAVWSVLFGSGKASILLTSCVGHGAVSYFVMLGRRARYTELS